MKRIIAAAVAVVALAGCGTSTHTSPHLSALLPPPPPTATDLAREIPKATLLSGSEVNLPIVWTPDYAKVSCYGTGQDVIATFPTNDGRTTWAQAMATNYGDSYNFQRVDGVRPGIYWTLFTAASSSSTRGYSDSNITDAASYLKGAVVLIGSK